MMSDPALIGERRSAVMAFGSVDVSHANRGIPPT
jgi:hypothetical protein